MSARADGAAGGCRRREGRPRFLVVVLAPVTPELGAAQVAINLTAALRERGIEVTVWSPFPMSQGVGWFQAISFWKKGLRDFIERHGPFDVIDAPSAVVTRWLARQGLVIARSVQPEIRYQFARDRVLAKQGLKAWTVRIARLAYAVYVSGHVIAGWSGAHRILCLGRLEYGWMLRWFPWWRRKTSYYINALSEQDRRALAEIRRRRKPRNPEEGIRFLWIGRWSAHKGVSALLDFIADRIERYPRDQFTIAGCGEQPLRHIAGGWLESGRVRVIPSFARSALCELLADHDAGLFTSHVEGWGLSLNEMLESGMPVWATMAGGVADLQPYFREHLLSFPPCDERRFPAVECENGSAYVARFSWPQIADQYESLLGALQQRQVNCRWFA